MTLWFIKMFDLCLRINIGVLAFCVSVCLSIYLHWQTTNDGFPQILMFFPMAVEIAISWNHFEVLSEFIVFP